MKKLLVAMCIVTILTGCAEPLDESEVQFAGLWRSNESTLLITESGRLEYETNKGAVSTSVSMPIKSIDSNQIKAGFLFFSSTFALDGLPVEEDGMQVLTVDGEKLFKTDAQGRIPLATRVPNLDKIRMLISSELVSLSDSFISADFTNHLNKASLAYQSQFTNEKLLEVYSGFVERKIDLRDFMIGEAVLTEEPVIDDQGVLRIAGRYPTDPVSLKFNLSFVYSHPEWKSLGGDIDINRN